MKGNIWIVEQNVRGAWVIYGVLGVRQYYGYKRKEAVALYESECGKTFLYNKDQRVNNGREAES